MKAIIGLAVFFLIYLILRRLTKKIVFNKLKPQTAAIVMKAIRYSFFVLTDHALKVGDFITVDEISGTVDTITMLSVKVKTSDGRIVRIPNETIINAKLQNVSSHPTRRFDVVVSVSYDTDLRRP